MIPCPPDPLDHHPTWNLLYIHTDNLLQKPHVIATKDKKSYKLKYLSQKKDIKSFAEALKDFRNLEEYKIQGAMKLSGAIYDRQKAWK